MTILYNTAEDDIYYLVILIYNIDINIASEEYEIIIYSIRASIDSF